MLPRSEKLVLPEPRVHVDRLVGDKQGLRRLAVWRMVGLEKVRRPQTGERSHSHEMFVLGEQRLHLLASQDHAGLN